MSDSGMATVFTTALGALGIGLVTGVVWERSQQPWQLVDGTLTVSGAQVLQLQERDALVRVAAEPTQAVMTLANQESSAMLAATPDRVVLTLQRGGGELGVTVQEDEVSVTAHMDDRQVVMELGAGEEHPTLTWVDAQLASHRCTLGPDAVHCHSQRDAQ